MQEDINALKEWSKIFENPILASLRLAENMITHSGRIMKDLHDGLTYFRHGQFFEYGTEIGKALIDAFGQAPDVAEKVKSYFF